ncbi:MAG: hypothetical protein PHE84_06515 [bacterium]|nr:hypothetical protein [bacterium]
MTIEERLEKLERELTELKKTSAARTKQISASTFLVVDQKGKTRGALTMIEDRVGVVLFDTNGKARVRLAVRKEGPMLRLQDENANPRAVLAVFKSGPSMQLLDEKGKVTWTAS